MRILDEGLTGLSGSALEGPARISALAHHAWLLVRPALELLAERAPRLIPHVLSIGESETREGLRRGSIDVAILEDAAAEPTFETERLVSLGYGVWCGAGHPLFEAADLETDHVLRTQFVVPPEGITDGWPPDIPRAVGVRVSSFQLALELCLDGSYLAVLPDAVMRANRSARVLRRLPVDVGEPRQLYLTYRRPLGEHKLTEVVCQALRDAAAAFAEPWSPDLSAIGGSYERSALAGYRDNPSLFAGRLLGWVRDCARLAKRVSGARATDVELATFARRLHGIAHELHKDLESFHGSAEYQALEPESARCFDATRSAVKGVRDLLEDGDRLYIQAVRNAGCHLMMQGFETDSVAVFGSAIGRMPVDELVRRIGELVSARPPGARLADIASRTSSAIESVAEAVAELAPICEKRLKTAAS